MNKVTSTYQINETEFCFNLESIPITPKEVKVNVPKLMAKIAKDRPTISKDSINSTIFCNAPTCKINVSRIMTMQNYITVRPHPNESPTFTNKGTTMIEKYNKFKVDIPGGDVRQIRLSSKY